MTSEAWARALEDLISPSAVITLALAALPASASAAIVLCSCVGSLASLLKGGVRKECSLDFDKLIISYFPRILTYILHSMGGWDVYN